MKTNFFVFVTPVSTFRIQPECHVYSDLGFINKTKDQTKPSYSRDKKRFDYYLIRTKDSVFNCSNSQGTSSEKTNTFLVITRL